MNFSKKKLIITFVSLIFLVAVTYRIHQVFFNYEYYDNAYSQINTGDSKEKVITLFGSPRKVRECSKYCKEEYIYTALLQEWKIGFDENGKVIHKFSIVSG